MWKEWKDTEQYNIWQLLSNGAADHYACTFNVKAELSTFAKAWKMCLLPYTPKNM